VTQDPSTLLPVILRTPVHQDLFAFSLRNPGFRMEFDGLCRSLSRSARDVESAVGDLVEVGWLHRRNSPRGDVVSFDVAASDGWTGISLEPYLALLRSASRQWERAPKTEDEIS
jgi:hypothetical protein